MVGFEKLESLADCRLWMAEHRGRTETLWAAQHLWNKQYREDMKGISVRISKVEKTVAGFAGLAAVVGAILGTFLSRWLM